MVRIVDALTSGRLQAARDIAFEYLALTQGEAGLPVPQGIQELPEPMRRTLDGLAGQHQPPGLILLALDGELVCGTVAPLPSWLTSTTDAIVQRLYVPVPHRRRGIAGRLMEAVHVHAAEAGFDRLLLNVMTSRTGAIALYRRLGYEDLADQLDWPYGGLWLVRTVPRSTHEVSTTDR